MWRIIRKAAKPILAMVFILATLLSGFPSQPLIDAMREYASDRNVVDLLYRTMKDGNVIDKDVAGLLAPRVEKAKAANFQMQMGYYMGTGSSKAITGVGFQPEFILIKSNTTAGAAVFKTSAMPASNTAYFSATANDTNTRLTLDSDGFTVGTLANLNNANVRYQWVAFAGSDCTSSGTFCVGTYTGNGSATQTVSTGFQPDLVIVKRSTNVAANFRTTSYPANRASYFTTTADNTAGGLIQSFTSSGFVVGSAVDNVSTGVYYFIAFKASSGVFAQGTYTGNATDNTNIGGVGFQPDFVFVKNSTSATTSNRDPAMTQIDSYGDAATAMGGTTAAAANIIQGLQSDGFQIGTSGRTNESSATFYYAAFAGAPAYSASGTFLMDSGTYTGTGSAFSVTGVSFPPDLVMIKDDSTQQSVFRTRLMAGDITAYIGAATADFAVGITSINSDGFSIGTSTVVNTSAHTYQWQAFGNAFNPDTNSGASDFIIGVYTGSGTDNRNVTRVPFQPDFVTTKRNGASAAVMRTSSQSGDLSVSLSATAEAANQIQALNSDGFQVGTATNLVNASGVLYRWFAFSTSTRFAVDNYTGNGADNTSIAGVGFQPDLVWVKRSTAVNGVIRPSTLSGDATQYFVNSANVADRIQTLEADGFQVGGSQTETNTNTAIYRYAAWDGKQYAQQAYRLFANANSADVGAALAATNSSSTLAASGDAFRLRVLLRVDQGNLFSSGQNFKLQFAARSGSCDTSFSGESYADVTGSTAIAYNNNSPSDGTALTANANDPTDGGRTIVNQTYEEANDFTNSQAAVNDGQDGKWDFALIDNSAPADTAYCFRIVKSDGSLLDSYAVVPEVSTASAGATVSCSTNITSTAFGTLSTGAVSTAASNASTTVTCSGSLGCTLTVQDAGNGVNPGLATTSPAYLIQSSTATLSAGTEGYGIRATTTAVGSGGSLAVNPTYNKTGNGVGGLSKSSALTLASSTAAVTGREVVVTHLAAISGTTQAGSYADTITYSCTGN